MADAILEWKRFGAFREARKEFRKKSSIYVLVSDDGELLYIGETGDLWHRYNGGTGSMVDAALDGSTKITYAAQAPTDQNERKLIEASLVYKHKPQYSVHNKWVPPARIVDVEHRGEIPKRLL